MFQESVNANSLIQLENIEYSGFSLYYHFDYKKLLFEEKDTLSRDLDKILSCYLARFNQNFRFPMELQGVQVLVSIDFDAKSICVFSSRLNYELSYIGFYEKSSDLSSSEHIDAVRSYIDSNEYKKFRALVLKVASMTPHSFPAIIEKISTRYNLYDLELKEYSKDADLLTNTYNKLLESLLENINEYKPTLFERVSDYGLNLTAQYSLIRIHLLKFLAILPSLDHDLQGDEVKKNLLESLRRLEEDNQKAIWLNLKGDQRPLPNSLRIVFKLIHFVFNLSPAKRLAQFVRSSVRIMAKRFIAGETIAKAEHSFNSLKRTDRDVTVDQLGELVVSENEADQYLDHVLTLIQGFSRHYKKGQRNRAGILCSHVSIKVSALCSDFKPAAFEATYALVAPRLIKILTQAQKHQVFIQIDAEHYSYRDLVFEIYKKVLLDTPELNSFADTGIVIQAYLRDAYEHFQEVLELAQERKLTMPIRLVKGAYWDAETIEAEAHSFVAPQFINKEETDIHFRQLIIEVLKASPHLQLCLASHNFSDHCFAQALRKCEFSDALAIEHQCLHMTYEALSVALGKMGWAVRNYVPIGSLIVGMAYLVRRIMENSSQVGVLTIMRSHKKKVNLVPPQKYLQDNKDNHQLSKDILEASMTTSFFNVAPMRLYKKSHLDALKKGIEKFEKNDLGKSYSENENIVSILCPSDNKTLVGKIGFYKANQANVHLNILKDSFIDHQWSDHNFYKRSLVLMKIAQLFLVRRLELTALIIYESGKTAQEALADVDEAIDFLNFYAREEENLYRNNQDYSARGVCVVISPWNFPLAIPCGMVASALVAGNSVCLKSSEKTPLIAQKMTDIFHEAGVPKEVFIHLPGDGADIGQALLESPKVSTYVFTGSKKIGNKLYDTAGSRVYTNPKTLEQYPTKVIAEMGGKNAIIVTANAELDETIAGILYSSYAHAGQKCSAASRIIVDERVKDRLIERLICASEDIKVGKSFELQTVINPMITAHEKQRLLNQVQLIEKEVAEFGGSVHVNKAQENYPGNCVGPVVVELPKHRAYLKESYANIELFAPVIHILSYQGLDEALKIFNATEYALTGGIFSQSQDDIDYLSSYMECGNLYINRSITGARVAIEPFGGFKMSGTGPKAGSKAYLKSFHSISANQEDLQTREDQGNDYHFKLSYQSLLSDANRSAKMELIFSSVIRQFEFLFQGLYTQQKEELINFRKWCRKNLEFFNSQEHYNRIIPGQLNYDRYDLRVENILYVEYGNNSSFELFMYVLAAIAQGVGVTVACRNEDAFKWWNKILNIFYGGGISKKNFDVFWASESVLEKAVREIELSKIIIHGDTYHYERIVKMIQNDTESYKHLKKVITQHDIVDISDFKTLCEEFVVKRSFAVNIMRYGAPMSLEKEIIVGS